MKIINKLKGIFHRKKHIDLRAACVDEFGEEFGEKYDRLNRGQPIGDIIETINFLNAVEKVRNSINQRKNNEKI